MKFADLVVGLVGIGINHPKRIVRRINICLGGSLPRSRHLTDVVRIADRRTAPGAIALPRVDIAVLSLNTITLGLILVLLSGAVWLNAT